MTVLSCITWARDQRRARRLPSLHGDALLTLATFANPDGECSPAVSTVAEILNCSRQHAQDVLRELERMGLLHEPERRGQAPAVRRLRLDAPSPDQLELGGTPNVSPRRHRRPRPMSPQTRPMSTKPPSNVAPRGDTKYEVLEEEPPYPPSGKRVRDRHDYDLAVREWSLRLMPGAGEEELAAIREALARVRWRERMDPAVAFSRPVARSEVIDYLAEHKPQMSVPEHEQLSATTPRGGGSS